VGYYLMPHDEVRDVCAKFVFNCLADGDVMYVT